MNQHGRHDIRIVNLFSCCGIFFDQFQQFSRHMRCIIRYLKQRFYNVNLLNCLFDGYGQR